MALTPEAAQLVQDALDRVFTQEPTSASKWAVALQREGRLLPRWVFTRFDVHTSERGSLWVESERFDRLNGQSMGYQVLVELAPGQWEVRVKLDG